MHIYGASLATPNADTYINTIFGNTLVGIIVVENTTTQNMMA